MELIKTLVSLWACDERSVSRSLNLIHCPRHHAVRRSLGFLSRPAQPTDLGLPQFGPVWFDVVHDAVVGSGESDSSDQQDDEHHVGERSCEVHDLKHTKQTHTLVFIKLLVNFNPLTTWMNNWRTKYKSGEVSVFSFVHFYLCFIISRSATVSCGALGHGDNICHFFIHLM